MYAVVKDDDVRYRDKGSLPMDDYQIPVGFTQMLSWCEAIRYIDKEILLLQIGREKNR